MDTDNYGSFWCLKKRYIILIIIVGLIIVGIIHSLGGSNAVTRSDGILISAKCNVNQCTFLFKGSDTLNIVTLNGQQYTPNYRFHVSGNWTVPMNNKVNETINYLLELKNAQAIEGVVQVQ